MNKMIVIVFITVISIAMSCSVKAKKEERHVYDIAVNDYYEGNIKLADMAPSSYWTLIVLNSNLDKSNKLLDKLAYRKLDLSSTVILLIGAHETKDITHVYHTKYQDKVEPYSWIKNINSSILKQLKISGTPVVMGMKDNTIIWQISGLDNSRDFNKISNRIKNWASKEDIK